MKGVCMCQCLPSWSVSCATISENVAMTPRGTKVGITHPRIASHNITPCFAVHVQSNRNATNDGVPKCATCHRTKTTNERSWRWELGPNNCPSQHGHSHFNLRMTMRRYPVTSICLKTSGKPWCPKHYEPTRFSLPSLHKRHAKDWPLRQRGTRDNAHEQRYYRDKDNVHCLVEGTRGRFDVTSVGTNEKSNTAPANHVVLDRSNSERSHGARSNRRANARFPRAVQATTSGRRTRMSVKSSVGPTSTVNNLVFRLTHALREHKDEIPSSHVTLFI